MSGADGRPHELEDELQRTIFDGESEATEIIVEEARETVDQQLENASQVDSTAVSIARVNVLLLGLLATALSLLVRSDGYSLADAVTPYATVGTVLILLSTTTAAVTISESSFRGGISGWNTLQLLREDVTAEQTSLILSKSYATWIEYNRDTEVRNSFYTTLTSFFLVAGLLFLSLGVYDIGGVIDARILLFSLLLLLVVMAWMDLFEQFEEFRQTFDRPGN